MSIFTAVVIAAPAVSPVSGLLAAVATTPARLVDPAGDGTGWGRGAGAVAAVLGLALLAYCVLACRSRVVRTEALRAGLHHDEAQALAAMTLTGMASVEVAGALHEQVRSTQARRRARLDALRTRGRITTDHRSACSDLLAAVPA
ncbi:hypothetical protein [Nocardioides bruguierae]|uniref:Uncharacterized protein n=1 Tax=Nocardioides bruguierae TaxID=2945102 RepID=A0A9X2D4Q5_9ACTN|nr:hypothetical protein [Nocardioides bruguierae]MCL8025911.1 hypothetical protein [Nocardioides bruguierae]MCM0619025.1 hypothetical protein [Nocardioides bruguierae]